MAEVVKDFFQAFNIVGLLGALDKHVVDVNFHVSIDLVLKDFVD